MSAGKNPLRPRCPYEVGDVLTTRNETHPSKRWPGTEWVPIEGRFILGASTEHQLGSAGGEERVSLTITQMPRSVWTTDIQNTDTGTYFSKGTTYSIGAGNTTHGQSHNNMPPYVAMNIWERTA